MGNLFGLVRRHAYSAGFGRADIRQSDLRSGWLVQSGDAVPSARTRHPERYICQTLQLPLVSFRLYVAILKGRDIPRSKRCSTLEWLHHAPYRR